MIICTRASDSAWPAAVSFGGGGSDGGAAGAFGFSPPRARAGKSAAPAMAPAVRANSRREMRLMGGIVPWSPAGVNIPSPRAYFVVEHHDPAHGGRLVAPRLTRDF